jgi:hypothetical protein
VSHPAKDLNAQVLHARAERKATTKVDASATVPDRRELARRLFGPQSAIPLPGAGAAIDMDRNPARQEAPVL